MPPTPRLAAVSAFPMQPRKISLDPPAPEPRSISDARYDTLLQAISQIVWTAAPDGTFDVEQPSWAAYTGQAPDEYRGWGWLEAVHPEDRLRVRQLWRRAVETGTMFNVEHRLRSIDGEYRWVVARAAPVLDDSARIREWIGANTDMHEARKAADERARLYKAEREARLAAERAMRRLREAQEISDAATAESDLHEMLHTLLERLRQALHADAATVLLLSDDATELVVAASLGMERELVVGSRIPLGQGFAGRIAAERQAVVAGESARGAIRREEVRDRLQSLIGAPLLAAGRLVGVIHAGTFAARDFADEDVLLLQLVADRVADTVDRVRLLESEREARAEAEAANRAKMDFLAMISHELRTPLNAIAGYAELLETGLRGALNEGQTRDVQAIHRNERHLLGLVEQLLSYAKLDAGRVELDITEFRLRPALESVLALVGAQVEQRQLVASLVDCDQAVRVRADNERFQQILLNLLSNAIKFTAPGGRIEIHCSFTDARAAIRVADTGIGMPPESLERIFEPFVQLDQRLSREHNGTGLGLAISRELARLMGGDLRASSEQGQGSVFTLEVPLAAS